jgi:hypothetical protein
MGDGVLAYFGYPRADEHDAERAVRAGLQLVEAVAGPDIASGTPLQVRIGIATGLVDDGGNAAVIGADHVAQFFRVEPSRKRRRADQIAKHHRQLPALGLGGRRCGRRLFLGRLFGAGDGKTLSRSAAIAFSNFRRGPTGSPSVVSQLRQHLGVDLVVGERRHIALKAQTLQPRLYVHALSSAPRERHLHLFEHVALPVDLPAAALK